MKLKKPEMTINGEIQISYNWSPGKAGERFFRDLRDHMKIMGTRCRKCSRVLVPPRIFCEECFTDDMEWVEVEPKGTLATFGDCYFSTDGKRLEKPWILGIVRLNGSNGGLIHYIGEATAEELKIGMPMEIVFKEQREGNILDILYFRPVKE
ncbi:MAG: Zn-ribbon domain-containing OB-fold protein [Deltaproteobacteria bacterium]|nr:Zn-ribbon domain-containing OB-fold protein [Deltaproteobacteria bacterium]